jgi:hypothetical protein
MDGWEQLTRRAAERRLIYLLTMAQGKDQRRVQLQEMIRVEESV